MTGDARRRFVLGKTLAIVAAVAIVAAAVFYFRAHQAADSAADGKGPRGANRRPQPVSVAQVKQADMPIWVNAIGTCVPRNLVTVHARVDGQLMRLGFVEGQIVKRGQVLAEIDPRPFQAQLLQATGQLAKDTATLRNAELDLERYRDLWAKDSIAKQQLDTQEALVRQYQGIVEADRGQVESAKLQLAYTRIVAPVDGRIGLRQVDPGNLVHASDSNGLAVIAQLQPTTVVFSVPESYLATIAQGLNAKEPMVVEAWDAGQKRRIATGRLLTMDNLVDTATGTIKLKAEFANKDGALFPNQFVNVRLLLGVRKNATVVPSAAILRGAKGALVYVVDAQNAVHSVAVVPGPADGDLIAVEGRLQPGSRVVADGADKLRDGAKVEVIPAASTSGDRAAESGRRTQPRPGGAPSDPARREGGAAPAR